MIPRHYLLKWSENAPWPDLGQVEQDLIISRALVALYCNEVVAQNLAFRGGTALNKLYFPTPLRYSEDIDLVQVAPGPIGPVLDAIREVLDPWLGRGRAEIKENAAKLRYRFMSVDSLQRTLKVEINTREHGAVDGYEVRKFAVTNRWFTGEATIRTFTIEELLATKLRALLQRRKGRDLFDLKHATTAFPDAEWTRIVDVTGLAITAVEQLCKAEEIPCW